MTRPLLALCLVALVVASGCLAAEPASQERVDTPTTEVPYDDQSPAKPTYDEYDNPWGTDRVEVVVEDHAGMERNIHPEVMRALSYWEEQTNRESAYNPDFRLVSQSDAPEIRVEVVQVVDGCGVHEDSVALGCAPVLSRDEQTNGTVTVRMRAGHERETTLAILKHEFGHTLGYRHGDEPKKTMSKNLTARAPENITDATDRTYPWSSETLRVAVEADRDLSDGQHERLRSALAYYERGAQGTVTVPPSFELVDDPEEAHIVVSFAESIEDCPTTGPTSSCAYWEGPDVDEDPKPEYYTKAHVVLEDEAHGLPGWHVGYWLGQSLWTNGVPKPYQTGERPPATTW
ncbi:hypothetical protein HALDL1_03325 [Halobacterium sp. DL1]|jgi:hypothetical protein|nr:hypothetical protein HALDL1_03325 [Halobacterium sp. DL1]